MMTVHEVSRLTGVSVRALQYYDRIGLLPPADYTEAGYRLYDEAALTRLQQILLFRELEFPLKEIRRILESPDFDRQRAIGQQIEMLRLKREHLDSLITLAEEIRATGGRHMDFSAFDTRKIEEYAKKAKETWGDTAAYREYEAKSKGRTSQEMKAQGDGLMAILAEFGGLRQQEPEAAPVQAQVGKLQDYITANYYTCTREILAGLGRMYGCGGEFTENINAAGGPGTAEFAAKAIAVYCGR